MNKIESNMEVEYKYWAWNVTKSDFHARVEEAVGAKLEPLYVVSCDDYYTRDTRNFLRYRKGGGTTELTLKEQRLGNVVRKEINLNMSDNDDSSIVEFLELSGYKKEFSVFKEAWIFHFDNCDVSYYTLSDGRSVVEIEAVNYDTTEEAIVILDKWVDSLSLNDLSREPRSLFEIFTHEKEPSQVSVSQPLKYIDPTMTCSTGE
jgi:adenylate cyclase class IV